MHLLSKYGGLTAAVERPEVELRADLDAATMFIAAHPKTDEAVRVEVVQRWIGQALRMRTPGLNGPLAWAAGDPLDRKVGASPAANWRRA